MADKTYYIEQPHYEQARDARPLTTAHNDSCTHVLTKSEPIKRAARKPALIGGAVGAAAATVAFYPALMHANNAAQMFAVCLCIVAIIICSYLIGECDARHAKARRAVELLNKMCKGQLAPKDIEYLNRFVDGNSIGDAAVIQPDYFDAVLQGRAMLLNHELKSGILSGYILAEATDWDANLVPYARAKRVFGDKLSEYVYDEDSLQRDYNAMSDTRKNMVQYLVDEYHL